VGLVAVPGAESVVGVLVSWATADSAGRGAVSPALGCWRDPQLASPMSAKSKAAFMSQGLPEPARRARRLNAPL
jgi:hypothetical protein